MIQFKRGSIFDSKAQTLVNPVNTVGVSGAGLAKEFKKRFPEAQRDYVKACKGGRFPVGTLLLHRESPTAPRWILHFATKEHWRDPSELAFVEKGLRILANNMDNGITSIAFPALGCGNGGLEWSDVKPLMVEHLRGLSIPVEIYEPMVKP